MLIWLHRTLSGHIERPKVGPPVDDAKLEKFRELLEHNHQWPDYYTFKFIVKAESHDQVLALLIGHEIQLRTSDKGTWISITSRLFISHTDQVLEVYRVVATVPGVMSL